MSRHSEARALPYTPEQMFDLVADVGRYAEFLPWVSAIRVRSNSATEMVADMIVGFKGLRETFTSKVEKQRPGHIHVDYLDGPLKYLRNDWKFRPAPGGYKAVMTRRKSLARPVTVTGIALHSGAEVTMRLAPAAPGAGILFRRTDLGAEIPARYDRVAETRLGTVIAEGAARLKFDGIVMRRMATEPVDMVCMYRRDNDNPVLDLFLHDVLPTFHLN